jgi:hypothetical protein
VIALVALVALGALTEAYFRNVQLASAVLGGFLGAPAGAGIAALVCQFGKGYCKKGKLGPLPLFGHVKHLAWLRAAYLGENPLRRPPPQTKAAQQQDSPEPVLEAIVLETPNAVCPYCNKPLKTANSKQCFECGADWHGERVTGISIKL